MAICHIIVHFITQRALWRGVWICVRSKDAQKQLARTSLISQGNYYLPENLEGYSWIQNLRKFWYIFVFFV